MSDEDKVARINKRSKAFRQRVQRFAARNGLGRKVATFVDGGVATKWVRRRDIRAGPRAQTAEWGLASGSDMYWAEKLAVGFLGPYFGAIDGHSGLPVSMQLEVLRCVRFVGPDAAPQPL